MKRTIKQTMQHLPPWWLVLPLGGVACTSLSTSETPKNENQEGNPRGFSRREFRVAVIKCACTKIVSATILTTEEVVSSILRNESRKASRTERHLIPDSWALRVHLEWLSCLWISGRWGSDDGTAVFESPQRAEKAACTRAVGIDVPTARGHYAPSIRDGTVPSVRSENADHGPL